MSRFSVSLHFPAEKPRHLNHSGHVRGPCSDPVCVVFRAVLAEGSCHEACPSLPRAYLWRALSFGSELRDAFCRGVVSGASGLCSLSAVHPVIARLHGLCCPLFLFNPVFGLGFELSAGLVRVCCDLVMGRYLNTYLSGKPLPGWRLS